MLYLSCSGISVRPGRAPAVTRNGDGHAAPESVCKQDCINRLIDAAASGRPEEALHQSWRERVPDTRRQAEAFLGYDPSALKRFWSQTDQANNEAVGKRVPLSASSQEFAAVQAIFEANPQDKTYNFNNAWPPTQIISIDRVESGGQASGANDYYERVKR